MSLSPNNDDVPELYFSGVRMAGKPVNTRWNLKCRNGRIHSINPQDSTPSGQGIGAPFITPSLCHPHIHLDKCFLLQHPKYADLEIQTGDFAEALRLTNEAKLRFERDDLMERGRALIEESISFGVTHMRAFVEVDLVVQMKCLEAGLALKDEFQGRCYIQLCVFAQEPITSYDDGGFAMKQLLEEAVAQPGVDAFGSTPYVEKGDEKDNLRMNIEFTVKIAMKYKLHLDFHIDYNLAYMGSVWALYVLAYLRAAKWPSDRYAADFRTVALGHCTRVTAFDAPQWLAFAEKCEGLPVSFIGLPTSDLYMMGRPEVDSGGGQRYRGTLQIPQMIQIYGLNAAIGVNNVGNAFTPQGSCDPLSLASLGVGVYQAGTRTDANILFQGISSRAKAAIGLHPLVESSEVGFKVGDPADFVIFGIGSVSNSFRSRRTIQDVVYDAGLDRRTILNGQVVS